MDNAKSAFSGKKIIFFLFLIIIFLFAVFGSRSVKRNREAESKYKDFSLVNYKLEGKDYNLLLADNPEKWERGLMNFRTLEGVDGMIFIFPEKEVRTFWNKNTFMDLELIWIDGDKIIGRSGLPSIEKSKEIVTVSSLEPADKVIEIPRSK